MTELICDKQDAIEWLKRCCKLISKGKITARIYNTVKEVYDTLEHGILPDVISVSCTAEELTNQLSGRLRRHIRKNNTFAVVFIGRQVSAYSISAIKRMFDGCVRPPAMFPEQTADDKIRIFLCTLRDTDDNSALYDIDYSLRFFD